MTAARMDLTTRKCKISKSSHKWRCSYEENGQKNKTTEARAYKVFRLKSLNSGELHSIQLWGNSANRPGAVFARPL